jgi:hypothetical protein
MMWGFDLCRRHSKAPYSSLGAGLGYSGGAAGARYTELSTRIMIAAQRPQPGHQTRSPCRRWQGAKRSGQCSMGTSARREARAWDAGLAMVAGQRPSAFILKSRPIFSAACCTNSHRRRPPRLAPRAFLARGFHYWLAQRFSAHFGLSTDDER